MYVLKGGRVLDPLRNVDEVADVVVEGTTVTRVGKNAAQDLTAREDDAPVEIRVLDCTGHWILPGFVDIHVHFREPGHEHKEDLESGLRAAAAGGFTTVCSMPNTNPVNDCRAITDAMVGRSRDMGGTRLVPFGAITQGLRGEQLSEMGNLRRAGALGVTDDGKCVMNAAVMRRAMEYAKDFDLLVSQHCEDHHLSDGGQMHEGRHSVALGLRGWPRVAEDVIVARDLLLAEVTRCRYHVAHISSGGAVELVRAAKDRGLSVSAEVTPHHLALTDEAVLGYNTHCKVNPPLREEQDRGALVAALREGVIDCMATDHAPHDETEKDCEFERAAVGINGLESAVSVMLDLVRNGDLSVLRFAEVMSTAPAKLIGDVECGGPRPKARADLTVVDPERLWRLEPGAMISKSHNSPWLHTTRRGRVVSTFVAGRQVYGDGAG